MTTAPIRCHCNSCAQVTGHEVVGKHEFSDSSDSPEESPWWMITYEVLKCRGCDTVCVRQTSESEDLEDAQVVFYPPRISRRIPTWIRSLPYDLQELLGEVYVALQNNSRRLALMGTRTVIDMVMLDQVGDRGNFKEKLAFLVEQRVIGSRESEVLNTALDAGSAASHRGYEPSSTDLNAVIDIVENLLQSTYHLQKLARKLKAITPPRPKIVK